MATEVADYLVGKGVAFRRAHQLVGKAVRQAQAKRATLADLDPAAWQALDPAFGPDVTDLFDPRQALARRRTAGSSGPGPIKRALVRASLAVKRNRRWLAANQPSY
jgi:argininosuccinate lyase